MAASVAQVRFACAVEFDFDRTVGEHPETDERPETETETANGGRRKIRSDKTEANPTETRYR